MSQILARDAAKLDLHSNTPPKINTVSLSKYFPRGTVYFYSFPSGEDSNFYNAVPPWKEELVAARPLVSGGDKIRAVTFASSLEDEVWNILKNDLGVELIAKSNIIALPGAIHDEVTGNERNTLLKSALRNLVDHGTLVMAQPFLHEHLEEHYQISPQLVIELNDKKSLMTFFPAENLPHSYRRFGSGPEFVASTEAFPLPCVVKVSSSSSGDGVRICRTPVDLASAKHDFAHLGGTIFVEEFVDTLHNLCIQFGIPVDRSQPIEIIGQNEQLVSPDGDYLGGVVNPKKALKKIEEVHKILIHQVLPTVRAAGWYGVGGIDVLVSKDERIYFIDPNFRMTAAFTYVCLNKNGKIKKPVASFTGTVDSETNFKKNIIPLATEGVSNQLLSFIALVKHGDIYRFNAGMFFEDDHTLCENAGLLLKLGVRSQVLEKLSDPANLF